MGALDRGVCHIDGNSKPHFLLKGHYIHHVGRIAGGIIIGAADGVFIARRHKVSKILTLRSVLCSYDDAVAHRLWLGTFHDGVMAVDDRTFTPLVQPGLHLPLMPVRAILPWDAPPYSLASTALAYSVSIQAGSRLPRRSTPTAVRRQVCKATGSTASCATTGATSG